MTCTEILQLLKEHHVRPMKAMVATSCDAAWNLLGTNEVCSTYDYFCQTCYEIWLDCEDNIGLTAIAYMVVDYIRAKKELPASYYDIETL